MTFRQVIRPGDTDDVSPHEHDASEVSGVFGFLRALKAKIDGTVNISGELTVGPNVDVIIGDANSTEAQLFIHNSLQHINLVESDASDYPDKHFIVDINGEVGRILWLDSPSTFTERMRFYGPGHATQANDIELLTSGGAVAMRWDDSVSQWWTFNDIVGDTDNDFYSRSYRTRTGPDASDFWIITESTDSLKIQQWDDSAAANIDRIEIIGTGTGVTDTGDILVKDGTGTEVARFTADGISTAARGTLGYAQVTTGQATITTEADLTGLTVTVTVGTSRRIKVTAQLLGERTVADGTSVVQIKEGTTYLQALQFQPNIANEGITVHGHVILTPTAASHTYKLAMAQLTGTGTSAMSASATIPASILVEDIGPA